LTDDLREEEAFEQLKSIRELLAASARCAPSPGPCLGFKYL
jgi:hypothetical protein